MAFEMDAHDWQKAIAAGLRWPLKQECFDLGCTCTWFDASSIISFADDCPILHLHKDGPGAQTKETPSMTIFTEAEELVNGPRAEAYGDYEENLTNIADMWGALLGVTVSARQVALCMAALKLAREGHAPKRDNLVDACGYLRLAEKLQDDKEEMCPCGIGGITECSRKPAHKGCTAFKPAPKAGGSPDKSSAPPYTSGLRVDYRPIDNGVFDSDL
jgi:hypothetical protein